MKRWQGGVLLLPGRVATEAEWSSTESFQRCAAMHHKQTVIIIIIKTFLSQEASGTCDKQTMSNSSGPKAEQMHGHIQMHVLCPALYKLQCWSPLAVIYLQACTTPVRLLSGNPQ